MSSIVSEYLMMAAPKTRLEDQVGLPYSVTNLLYLVAHTFTP